MTPEQENRVRQIFAELMAPIVKSDRFTIGKLIQILDSIDFQLGRTLGTRIGTDVDQKLGFFGKTPVSQLLKADYNNFATATDLMNALADIGLIDSAGAAGLQMFAGSIADDGTAISLPSGWSSVRVSNPGQYRITHTMATANFAFIPGNASIGSTANLSFSKTSTIISYDADIPATGFSNAAIDFIIIVFS